MSKIIEVEAVPGMSFRRRKVYLEKLDHEKDEKKLKMDCVVFHAEIGRAMQNLRRAQNRGLIIRPGDIN